MLLEMVVLMISRSSLKLGHFWSETCKPDALALHIPYKQELNLTQSCEVGET